MKIEQLTEWLDRTLNVSGFDDVSNNGLQIARNAREIGSVAVAVDASLRSIRAAAEIGADMLVVHHGISWGGGIRRIDGGVYNIVSEAMKADVAVYACHLPIDAHPTLGNNAILAKKLALAKVRSAFCWHGAIIGRIGVSKASSRARIGNADSTVRRIVEEVNRRFGEKTTVTLGVCSGGAGDFAEEAQRLGCDLYVTGEADWGETIAAENCGMPLFCAGHYETEVYGVRAIGEAISRELGLKTLDLT